MRRAVAAHHDWAVELVALALPHGPHDAGHDTILAREN
jgi:hypothetical protein